MEPLSHTKTSLHAKHNRSNNWVAWLALGLSVTTAYGVFVHPPGSSSLLDNGLSKAVPAFQLAARDAQSSRSPFQIMFQNNPNLVADVAEQVAPSVVNIDVEEAVQARGAMGEGGEFFPFDPDMLRRFFGFDPGFDSSPTPFRRFGGQNSSPNQDSRPQNVLTGNGSGVIINDKGYILTNNHVVAQADKLTVTLNDGRKFPAKIVGRDRYSDLAVVKIDNASNLKPAVLGSSDKLRPGEWVLAIGSPLGFDHTVTMGIVSAISRRVPDINSNVDFIQTDAAINPGNSGGPLVNLKGEVIGINTAISGRGQNIGFAIPVNTAKQVAESLLQDGKIIRPWIGISMTALSPDLAKSLGLPENTEGIVVAQVLPGSPAEKAGFRQGDVIQRLEGQKVSDPKAIQGFVQQKPVNTLFHVQILRENKLMALSVKTEQLPNSAG